DFLEETAEGLGHPPEEADAGALHDGEGLGRPALRSVLVPVRVAHVRTRVSSTTPSSANSALGTHAARSGGMSPLLPTALVICTSMRKTTVIARLMPMPYAAPPRCVLVASGAPNKAMMMQVMGIAILSARSTRY